jgi:hypothetical protein
MDSAERVQLGDQMLRALTEFPWEAAKHFLPLLIIGSGRDVSTLPAPIQAIMAEFVQSAGLAELKDPGAIGTAIARYYQAHPVDPAIRARLDGIYGRAQFRSDGKRAAKLKGWSRRFGDPRPEQRTENTEAPRGQSLLSILIGK